MNRRLLMAALVLVAVNVWAGDEPWQKSYKEWNATDVRKILNDSPWSKTVEIERLNLRAPAGAPQLAGPPGVEEEDEQEEPDNGGPGRDEQERKRADARFRIRWVSSRTLREASVRGQVLQGKITEADTDKYMPPSAQDYELALVGVDMSPFQKMDESALRDKTYLIATKSRQKVMASQVEIVHASDGKRINAVVFHFPKNIPSGQAVVVPDDKELKFVTRTETIEVKASFDLQRMTDPQGKDL